MATRSVSKAVRATPAAWAIAPPGYSDDTGARIRGYLASVRPLRGVADLGDRDEYQRGRGLIERLALSARGTGGPTLQLSIAQCADVLHFIHHSEPLDPSTWWSDLEDALSHVVGFDEVLLALESSLRARVRR